MKYILYTGLALKEKEVDDLNNKIFPERYYEYVEAIGYTKRKLSESYKTEFLEYNYGKNSSKTEKPKNDKLKGFRAAGNKRDAAKMILEDIHISSERPEVPRELFELYGESYVDMKMTTQPYTYGYKNFHPIIIKFGVDSKKVILNPNNYLEGLFDNGNKWSDEFKNALYDLFDENLINEYRQHMDDGCGYKVLSSLFAKERIAIDSIYKNKTILMSDRYGKDGLFTNFIVKGDMDFSNVVVTDYYGKSIYDIADSIKPNMLLTSNKVLRQ